MTTTESVAPAANPVGTIQVTVCATLLQVHPPVEDDRLATVRFAGTTSVTVTAWVVGPAAETPLDTESVKLPVPPEATVAVAGAGVVPPPPVEVRVLANGEPVADAAV